MDPRRPPSEKYLTPRVYSRSQPNASRGPPGAPTWVPAVLRLGGTMGRKLQIGALILGMVLVAAERFTANASQLVPGSPEPILSEGVPIPPNN